MSPRFTAQNAGYLRLADAIEIGKALLAHNAVRVSLSHLSNLLCRESCASLTFASRPLTMGWLTLRKYPTTLVIHVVGICLDIAKKEMVRTDASRRVAMVQDPLFRHHAIVDKPRHPRGERGNAALAHVDAAVPLAHESAGPQPATGFEVTQYLGPETFLQRSSSPGTSRQNTRAMASDESSANASPNRQRATTATRTQRGNLFLHRSQLLRCQPPAAINGAGAFACQFYSTKGVPNVRLSIPTAVSG